MKKVLIIIAAIILATLLFLAGVVIWLTATDYRPESIEEAQITNNISSDSPESLTILNWNIGYGGLGEEMDFFMDGGVRVRAPEEEYGRYWQGIQSYLKETSYDIYFFQEMDRRSTRSYKTDQYLAVSEMFPRHSRSFTSNYKVKYIPSPSIIGRQYGSVHSGLSIFSRFPFESSERHALPGNYAWPKSVFFLDRCLLVSTVVTETGQEIVFINAHLSAYDKGGFLKKEQLQFLKELAIHEYEEGRYVIIGGDWNSYMPGTDGSTFPAEEEIPVFYQTLPEDWEMEGWIWGVDPTVPTNRSLATDWEPGRNFTSVIDGFLLSPNLKLESVKTIDLGFRHSDHNPTEINIILQ